MIPNDWTPNVPMERIVNHWTGGGYNANETDKRAYHLLIQGDLRIIRGDASIERNSRSLKHGYAAHTLNLNTGSIGVSCCSMAGAVEAPFNPGRAPLKADQWDTMAKVNATLCERFGIPVTRQTVLSHAEVQPTLNVTQRWKWDIARVPWDDNLKGAIRIGDLFRERVISYMKGEEIKLQMPTGGIDVPDSDPIPTGGIARVTASSLNFRIAPDGLVTGSLPRGTEVEVIGVEIPWVNVKTPAGYVGWVSKDYLDMIDGPPAEEPTKPDPRREIITELRGLVDKLENML